MSALEAALDEASLESVLLTFIYKLILTTGFWGFVEPGRHAQNSVILGTSL